MRNSSMNKEKDGDNRRIPPLIFFLSLMVTLLFPTVLLAMQVYVLFRCCRVTFFMMAVCVTLTHLGGVSFSLNKGKNCSFLAS